MSSISDVGKNLSTQYILQALRGDLDNTTRQISTGKKSTNLGGMGALGAATAISFRNKSNVLDAYTDSLKQAAIKFEVMDTAMGVVSTAARDTLTNLRKQLQSGSPKATILSDEARTQLQSVMEKMNLKSGDHYMFAGDDLTNKPFANPSALNSSMAGLVTGWLTGTTPTAVMAAARGVSGTALGYSATLASAGNISFRADEATDIDYTTKANQPGFADIMRGLAIISNLPAPTTATETTNYWNIVNGAIELLDAGSKAVDEYQGQLGNKANQVNSLLSQHADNKVTFESFIGDIEDVDMAEASTRLQNLQTQMQASYSVIAKLKDVSLINYI